MSTYTRPTVTRSYDAIYDDIRQVVTAQAHDTASGAEFWRARAAACEQLRDLWNEITFQAADDPSLPHWTRFAAITTRDKYADDARDAQRVADDRSRT